MRYAVSCALCLTDGWFSKREDAERCGVDFFPKPIPHFYGLILGWGRFEHFCSQEQNG